MQIKLIKLKITNFKGIKHFEFDCDQVTNIYGHNREGKTTIFDSFLWLNFGKNSNDESKFGIKPFDIDNNFIKDIETEVAATIEVNGQTIVVRKVLRQKWPTRRGSIEREYAGDENIYFWNDVPLKESEFKVKIDGIVGESVFKLITNPFYFNSLKWQDRRNTLISIAGETNDKELLLELMAANKKTKFNELITALNQNKTIDEFKREIAVKKKKIKDEADIIPIQISEVKRNMPEPVDFEQIKCKIHDHQEEVGTLQKSIDDESLLAQGENRNRTKLLNEHHQKKTDRQDRIHLLKTDLQNIEFDAKTTATESDRRLESEINSKTRDLDDKVAEKNKYSTILDNLKKEVETKKIDLTSLQNDYDTEDKKVNDFNEEGFITEIAGINAQIAVKNEVIDNVAAEIKKINNEELSFDNVEFSCPSCNQKLPTNNIEEKKAELLNNFNTQKEERLKELKAKGNSAYDEIDILDEKIKARNNERTHYAGVFNSTKVRTLNAILEKIEAVKTEIKALDSRIENGGITIAKLEKEIAGQQSALDALNQQANAPKLTTDMIVKSILDKDSKYQSIKAELSMLETTVIEDIVFPPIASNEELKTKRDDTNRLIIQLQKQLNDEDAILKAEARVKELQEQEKTLIEELNALDGIEYAILQFTKAKIEAMEAKLNGKFSMVKFKLFATQVNGGETECCETLIDGVPFSDANNASRINAGIDIINALCKHYDVSAPIFIDNRESVVELIASESQIVNLIVLKDAKLSVGKPKFKTAA